DSLDWTPDSKQIVTGYDNGSWQFWNVDGTPGEVQSGHFESVMGMACRPDGKLIVSGGWDDTIRTWNPDGSPQAIYDVHAGPLYFVNWSPDGKHLATISVDRTIRIWSMDSPRVEMTVFHLDGTKVASYNAAGKRMS